MANRNSTVIAEQQRHIQELKDAASNLQSDLANVRRLNEMQGDIIRKLNLQNESIVEKLHNYEKIIQQARSIFLP